MFKAISFIVHMQFVKKYFINENIFFDKNINSKITKFVRRYEDLLEDVFFGSDLIYGFQIIGWSSSKIDEANERFNVNIKTGLKRLDVYKARPNFGKRTGFKILSEGLYFPKIDNMRLPFSRQELDSFLEYESLKLKHTKIDGFIDSVNVCIRDYSGKNQLLYKKIANIYINYFNVFLKYAHILGIHRLNGINWNFIIENKKSVIGNWYNFVRYLTDLNEKEIIQNLKLTHLKYIRLYSTSPNDDIFIGHKEAMGTYKVEIDSIKTDYPQQNTYFEFKNVFIEAAGMIYNDKNFYETDPALDATYEFSAGRWNSLYALSSDRVITKPLKRTVHIPTGVFLSTKDDANWFHWVIEGLPRILNYKEHMNSKTPLIISSDVTPSGIKLLRKIYTGPLKVLPKYTRALVDNLISLNPVTFHPDSQEVPFGKSIKVNYHLMKELRTHFINLNEVNTDNPNFEKIYLVRTSPRRKLLNQEAVIRVVLDNGYRIFDFSKIDPILQFKLVHNAKRVIAPGGASMVSYLFASKNTEITTIVGANLKDFLVPFVLCDISRADHNYFLGNPVYQKLKSTKYDRMHSDFEVHLSDFKKFIKNF